MLHAVVPVQAPDHPENVALVPGVSLSVIFVFWAKLAEQVVGQLIPAGLLVTVPEPVGVTVRVKLVGGVLPPPPPEPPLPPEPPVPPLPPVPLPPVFPLLTAPHAARKSMHKKHNSAQNPRYREDMARLLPAEQNSDVRWRELVGRKPGRRAL